MKYDVVSLGTVYADINLLNFPLQRGLKLETETVGNNYELVVGGSAYNFAKMCRRLDLNPLFIGKVGNDQFGHIVEELMKKDGISPALIKESTVQTNISLNYSQKNKSLMTVVGSANQTLETADVESQLTKYVKDIRYIYFGGCFKLEKLLPFYAVLARKIKRNGTKIILDHGRVTNRIMKRHIDYIKKLLPYVDYYLPSMDEFLQVWNVSSYMAGLKKINALTKATVIIKNGDKGSIGFYENQIIREAVYSVPVRHIIGAGDAFNAGFIRALIDNRNMQEAMLFATASAALKISKPGFPSYTDIIKLMKHG